MMQPRGVGIVLGLAFVVAIRTFLARRRAWFERWVLSRRDFRASFHPVHGPAGVHVLKVDPAAGDRHRVRAVGRRGHLRAGALVFLLVTRDGAAADRPRGRAEETA